MNPGPIVIDGNNIGPQDRPFVIAEMSGNHNGSLERALEIVEAAAKAGAHAIKLQTYTADTMTIDEKEDAFFISDPDSLWTGTSLHELYKKAYTPWEWHKPLFDRARQLSITAFSSPFDHSAVDFLEELEVPAYKIASFENTDHALIKKAAGTGKPLIISTGMATETELMESVAAAREAGCTQLVLLKCTSSYPASPENTNLATIPDMREKFGCEIGLSDHTLGIGVSVASIALGVRVIEKHFTLARADGGVDSAFSMEPDEMSELVTETTRAWLAMGAVKYGPTEAEKNSMVFRRSLYVVGDMKEGDVFSPENLRSIRPGYGLAPKHLDELLGKCVNKAVQRGTPASWDLID